MCIKKEVVQEFDANNAPNETSATNLESTSNNSIPDLSEKSNPSDKKHPFSDLGIKRGFLF